MKVLALAAIRFYQKVISPRKGFCCAYAKFTGRGSCSALGYRAIRRFGVWRGLSVLDGRLEKCGIAYRRYQPAFASGLAKQAGFLDCGGCDAPGCDMPSCDLQDIMRSRAPGCGCDALSNCGSCDWNRRKRDDEQYVVIPPRGGVRR